MRPKMWATNWCNRRRRRCCVRNLNRIYYLQIRQPFCRRSDVSYANACLPVGSGVGSVGGIVQHVENVWAAHKSRRCAIGIKSYCERPTCNIVHYTHGRWMRGKRLPFRHSTPSQLHAASFLPACVLNFEICCVSLPLDLSAVVCVCFWCVYTHASRSRNAFGSIYVVFHAFAFSVQRDDY